MRVLQINTFGNLSTGRIATDIYRTLLSHGHEGAVAYARNTIPDDIVSIKVGNTFNIYVDGLLTRLTDRAGFFSRLATKKLITEIDKYNPDIIHLHNLHGYYVNIEILFDYLKNRKKPVVWTLHDCWAFTGHCCYYSMAKCTRWKTGCVDCPQKNTYPKSIFLDRSKENYLRKERIFTSISNLHLVTVSKWLQNEVKESFLKNLPCTTIYNGIDTDKFKCRQSNFRKKYNLDGKFVVLGVASTWDNRKGFKDFCELSALLGDDYKIVLVGVDKRIICQLKGNMIGIERTDSIEELAEIYSAADVFFNASVEETFGLTTVESISCGTPVIVYNATALPEVVTSDNGVVVDAKNVQKVSEIIKNIKNEKIKFQLSGTSFSKSIYYEKYIDLYYKLLRIST